MQDFTSPPPPLPSGGPPPVWRWFVIYTIALGIVYLGLAVFGIVALLIDPAKLDMPSGEAKLMGAIFLGIGLIFALPFLAAPYLPRKSWVWIYDLVLICIGMTSACCIPACIPLLIHWLKPETKAFFNRV
jgi:hypothetical protein